MVKINKVLLAVGLASLWILSPGLALAECQTVTTVDPYSGQVVVCQVCCMNGLCTRQCF